MNKFLTAALIGSISIWATSAQAKKTPQEERGELDKMANETLTRLYKEKPEAKALQAKAYGYAVFDQTQTALMISGGGGSGVAYENASKKRTYMKMASGGIGLGVGVQMMFTVFMFETKESFDKFLNGGVDADTSASAAAGTAGKSGAVSFTNGVALFQMTDKGLIAQASIKGTKYWKDDDLNAKDDKLNAKK